MIGHLLVPALTLAVLTAVAFAQGGGAQGHLGTPEQQRACRPDVQRFCREIQNQGDYAIADCLKTNTPLGLKVPLTLQVAADEVIE